MAQDLESLRDRVIRRVMRNISRRVVHSGPLPVRAEDGSYPVVVTLPEDTVGDMEERRNRISRDANVVVAYPNSMVLIAMRDGAHDDPAEVPADQTMDMLVTYLRSVNSDETPAIRITAPAKVPSSIEELEYAF